MPIIHITDAGDPRIAEYRGVPDPERLRQGELFVAENRLVVRTLLCATRFRTRSVLVTEAARASLSDVLAPLDDRLPVYVCSKTLIHQVSGFNIHRGCLALGERLSPVAVVNLLATLPRARRLVVLEGMSNADNVGGVFRNARAFGADAVVVGPGCCDPLYRKAIRVSIGATLVVPFATADDWPAALGGIRRLGFIVAALTPAPDAVVLEEFRATASGRKIALIAGNEGAGISVDAQRLADVRVRIPMTPGVDSLNASTATGIALYALAQR